MPENIAGRALARTAGPALSIAAIQDGTVVYARGFGTDRLEERRAATAETAYNIASLTKQFTATCILLLAREHELSLDTPVAAFLPELPHANRVTLRHLLTHTSGYVDYYPLGYADEDKLVDASPEEIVARYAGLPLQFEPGSAWSYSNTGYHILGRIVEIVGGLPFGDFLTTRVVQPAGMSSSFFNDPPRIADRHAFGYTRFCLGPIRRAEPERAGWTYSSGGLASTAIDLATWCIALLEHRILNEGELSLMMTPYQLRDGTNAPSAMGWFVEQNGTHTLVLHSGGVSGFATQIVMLPARRIAVVVLGNGDHLQVGLIARSLLEEIAGAPFQPALDVSFRDAELAELNAWVARFQSGSVETERLTKSMKHRLTRERIADAKLGLGRLGSLEGASVLAAGERGGMRWVKARVRFSGGDADVLTRTTMDGKLAELNASPIP